MGVAIGTVGNWETDTHQPTENKAKQLAKFLGLSQKQLRGEEPLSSEQRALGKMNVPRLVVKLEVANRAVAAALDELRPLVGRKASPKKKRKKKSKGKRA